MTVKQLEKAIKSSAFLSGDFTTRAGKKTDYYIDKYLFETQPHILSLLTTVIADSLESLHFDLIAAPAFGAVPISALLSQRTQYPFIIIKHQDKQEPLILGSFQDNQNVIIIEDILTSGKTALETAIYLKKIGLNVVKIICVVDREEGGVQALENHGFSVLAITSASQLKQT